MNETVELPEIIVKTKPRDDTKTRFALRSYLIAAALIDQL